MLGGINLKSITVFTPTFNRADLLLRCFESMKRQTNQNFVWMVIDDGSTDNTQDFLNIWKNEKYDFDFEFYYKENGGLHTAYNEAIAHIKTPLCVCVDSDDFMPDNAIEKILAFWESNRSKQYAGIVGLDAYLDGTVIGDLLPAQESINLIDLMVGRYPIKNGDRKIVLRTELYKKYAPMKVFKGEKNFNPHYMHLQISLEYDFLVLNEKLCYVEYQSDGMSNSMLKQYKNSPNSFAEHRKLYLNFPNTPLKFRFRHSIHLVSSCILSGDIFRAVRESPCKIITFFSIPFGILLSLYIKLKVRN